MTNHQPDDPFADLYVESLDKPLTAQTLKPFVKLDVIHGEILPTENWEKLNLQGKILIFLLARKALKIGGKLPDYQEEASPALIESETGLKGGSIRPSLAKLLDEKLVRVLQGEGGRERGYIVPDHVVPKINRLVMEKTED